MGKEVVYCFNCGVRLVVADFEKGKAFRAGAEVACADCLPSLLNLLPPGEREAFRKEQRDRQAGLSPRATGRVPGSGAPPHKSSSTRIRPNPELAEEEPPSPPRRRLLFLLAGAAGLLVVIVIILMATRKGPAARFEEEPAPASKTRPAKPPPPAPPATSGDVARQRLEKSRKYRAEHPEDLQGQVAEFERVAWEHDKTAAAEEARKEAAEIRKKLGEGMNPAMEKLLGEIRAPLEREEYGPALEILSRAKDRDAAPAWILQVDRRIEEVRSEAERKFSEVKRKAEEARGKGETEEVRKLRERVARWGIGKHAEEFDRTFGAPAEEAMKEPAKPAARTDEGKAYLEKWKEAVRPATNRDYAAAIANVERAAQGAGEEAAKREAEEDLQDLRAAEAFLKAALKAVEAWGVGQAVSAEVVTPSGAREAVEGTVVGREEDHLEVKKEGQRDVTFLDPAELSAPSLVKAAREAGSTMPSDLRAAAVFLLLEGEAEAAKTVEAGEVPEKYREYAKEAREKAPRAEGGEARKERESKRLYWAAEKEFGRMEALGEAIEKYRTLAKDYVGTSIVRKHIERITLRSEAGKDYFLPAADLKGSGAVKLAPHPELKACWTCVEDVGADAARARETYAEIEFHALPGTAYQCWVYAGACCEETFAVYLQATDMTGPNPKKPSEKVSYDVGAAVASLLAPKPKGLKKTHAQHGAEKPAPRWEWIAVPLPKYPSGGLKKIRLMTEHKGFSVGIALVSSVRKGPPKDDEFRQDFRKAMAEADARPRRGGAEAGLVGHWRLDEGGSVARDSSGQNNNGTVKGNPRPVPGKIGNGLAFDGGNDYIEIPGNPALKRLQEGTCTISAWFKPADTPPGKDSDNKSSYGIVLKPGHHMGLHYTGANRFQFEYFVQTTDPQRPQWSGCGTWDATSEPGPWYHVVGVADVASRTLRLYVDGKLRATSKPWDAGAKPREYGDAPWRIGCANPGGVAWGWPAKGVIDDVRLYSRALGAEEVQALYGAGVAGVDQ